MMLDLIWWMLVAVALLCLYGAVRQNDDEFRILLAFDPLFKDHAMELTLSDIVQVTGIKKSCVEEQLKRLEKKEDISSSVCSEGIVVYTITPSGAKRIEGECCQHVSA